MEAGSRSGSKGAPSPRRYSVHGIHLKVASESPEFLALCDWMLGAFRPPGPNGESIDARMQMNFRGWLKPPGSQIPWLPQEERLGTHEFREADAVRYRDAHYSIEYADGNDARVQIRYVQDRRTRLRGILQGETPWPDLYALFRLAIQEPLLLKLERRGAVLLHAAAVAQGEEALLFVGLNGSGKSTLCAGLLDRFDYVTDNFAAWDGRDVLGFPSALRIPAAGADDGTELPVIHGKVLSPPDPGRTRAVARPRGLVFVSLGGKTSLSPITSQDAVRHLLQVREMTHEFPSHCYLGSLSPPLDLARIQELAAAVPAYRLVMADREEARRCATSLF